MRIMRARQYHAGRPCGVNLRNVESTPALRVSPKPEYVATVLAGQRIVAHCRNIAASGVIGRWTKSKVKSMA